MFETPRQLLYFLMLAFTPGLSVLAVFYATVFLASRSDGPFDVGFLIFVSLMALTSIMFSLPLYFREAMRQAVPRGLLRYEFQEELWEDDVFFPAEGVASLGSDQKRKETTS